MMDDDAVHSTDNDSDNTTTTATFDYVVIGSGPSCAGLIWGLLQQPERQQEGQRIDHKNARGRAPPPPPMMTIAIVERGPIASSGSGTDGASSPSAASTSTSSSPFHWFRSSHDPCHVHTALHQGTVNVIEKASSDPRSLPSNRNSMTGCDNDDDIAGSSSCFLWRRVLDVPVGRGWGGTSLVNACLCQLPHEQDFSEWPEPFTSKIMDACRAVRHQLANNGCLLRWSKGRSADDDGDDGSTIELTVKKECHRRSVDDDKNNSNALKDCDSDRDPSSVEYRRCSYWEGLLGGPSSQGVVHKDSSDDLWTRFRRHVHVIQGQAERLLVVEEDQDGCTFDDDVSRSRGSPPRRVRRRRVVGVEISCGVEPCHYRILRARRDVILCAGAIETPALLLVSNIGRGVRSTMGGGNCGTDTSRSHGPGPPLPVGIGLRDHVALSRAIWTFPRGKRGTNSTVNGVASLRTIQVGPSIYQIGVLEGPDYPSILPTVMSGWFRGTLASCRGDARASRWRPSLRDVSMALVVCSMAIVRCLVKHLLCVLLMCPKYSPIVWLLRNRVVTVTVFLLNPTSTGRVAIIRREPRSASRDETTSDRPPLRRGDVELDIQLGYLESKGDVDAMHTGWIVSQSLLDVMGVSGIEIFPGFAIRKLSWPFRLLGRNPVGSLPDMDRFRFFARCTCLPYFHWSGSCRMATEDSPNGVVRPDLKVRGYDGLRICDASVFPTLVSAPTALTCAALGYVFGRDVLNKEDDT